MKKRFFRLSSIIVITGIVITCLFLFLFFRKNIITNQISYLENLTRAAANNINTVENYQEFADNFVNSLTGDYRLTVIDANGTVMAESAVNTNPEEMENHINRPEVQDALSKGSGYNIRKSSTTGISYLYYAFKTDWGFIRLSTPLSEIKRLQGVVIIYLFGAAIIGILAAIGLSNILSHLLERPVREFSEAAKRIAEGDYNNAYINTGYSEFEDLASSFITMSKKLQNAFNNIQSTNSQLDSIVQNINEIIILLDASKNIVFINNKANELLPVKNIVGKQISSLLPSSDLETIIGKSITSNSPVEGEAMINSNTYGILALPVNSERSKLLVTLRNITNLRKLERMRSDFVSNVTHELRTPLTSIRGFIDTLKASKDMPVHTRERFMDIISIEADRLSMLIDDMLLLSQIENERLLCCTEKVIIKDVFDDTIELLTNKAESRHITIVTELSKQISVQAGNNRIRQLVLNIVDNAVKYNNEGGTVWMNARKEGKITVISIEDNGPGIPEEYRERIFERFYRIDKGRTKDPEGTGLGLAIVKHIVGLYNGDIKIKTGRNNTGSLFEVFLP